jgi:hypothetical protein
MRWVGNIEHMAKDRRAYKVSVEDRQGKRSPGRLRYKGEDTIKMDRNEIEWEWSGFIVSGLRQVVGSFKHNEMLVIFEWRSND